jgi:5-methylcytosine-specific restriction endonuclease McrA
MSNAKHKDHCWSKASPIRGKNPDTHRRDAFGNDIYYHSYGKNTPMGWHVDHKKAKAKGGSDHRRNLQALQARANMSKGAR